MSIILLPHTTAAHPAVSARPDPRPRLVATGSRRPSRASATRSLGASLVAIVAMVLWASGASGQVTDTLWAVSADGWFISVCQNPTSPSSISSCFGQESLINLSLQTTNSYPPTTDGTNVYFGTQPGYSCPLDSFGQYCSEIQLGWAGFQPTAVAAAGGYLWLGGNDGDTGGVVYRCPSDLWYRGMSSAPDECVLLGQLGQGIESLNFANKQLYAVSSVRTGFGDKYTHVWSCDPTAPNSCAQIHTIDETPSSQPAAVGGGYIWIGDNVGNIYRCDPTVADSCQVWDKAGQPINSIADDGQGTLWVAVANLSALFTSKSMVTWSCPQARANSCSTAISDVYVGTVTAGAGQGFSAFYNHGSSYPAIAWGATRYPRSVTFDPASGSYSYVPRILYIPAGGPTALGGVKVNVRAPAAKVARLCAWRGTLPATIDLRGPHKHRMVRRLNLCADRSRVRHPSRFFNLLHPGTYKVRVHSSEFSGTAEVVVAANSTAQLGVRLHAPKVSHAASQ